MQFDEQFLEEMGLGAMPESQKEQFLAYLQEELEVRIGEQISEGVPEERLAEFDRVETQDEAAAWLKENRPDYREIVDRAIDEMKKEIEENRERLLGENIAAEATEEKAEVSEGGNEVENKTEMTETTEVNNKDENKVEMTETTETENTAAESAETPADVV